MSESKSDIVISLGAGAVVVWNNRVLFVRGANDSHAGAWQLPGGYVEKHEAVEEAVVREVREEAGLDCEVVSLIGLRQRVWRDPAGKTSEENDTYFVFLMRPLSALPQPNPDGVETDRAEFLTFEEIIALAPCAQIFKEMAGKALRGEGGSLTPTTITAANGRQYTAYM
jgi:ADP-ribose pyrophosphatase YjhB (NUDIX family)